MKLLFFILVACSSFSTNAQEKATKDSLRDFTFMANKDSVLLDSFDFCGKYFKIPRDCNKKSLANCCSGQVRPAQMACYNGNGLSWTYFNDINIAEQNVESFISQMVKQQKITIAEPITCNLMGKQVKAYRVACTTTENHKWNVIITSGVVFGQPVLVELRTEKPLLKNKELQPVFRQIVRLVE
ncbi:MAG TPA: hypothetical protein VMR70_10385 [Flavisolibacter sp.]|nr:hypothetical protein [Flavisolibacter sp.]